MAKRVQSPSSIKTYQQCPRKYYYHYIEKIPSSPSIHTVRGTIAHAVLEDFFDQDVTQFDNVNQAEQAFTQSVQQLLIAKWKDAQTDLAGLDLTKDEEIKYFEETMMMMFNWLQGFMTKLRNLDEPLHEAFAHLTPIREQEYRSETHQVRGFIDAIENVQGVVRIMDYKTNSSFKIEYHHLQLSIYAMMYQEKHGKLPDYTGIYFLRGPEKLLRVSPAMVDDAKKIIANVHAKTASEDKGDYPMRIQRLCKWRTGQCDYYDFCFKNGVARQQDTLTPLTPKSNS
jgi:putative RecB family exonuclease